MAVLGLRAAAGLLLLLAGGRGFAQMAPESNVADRDLHFRSLSLHEASGPSSPQPAGLAAGAPAGMVQAPVPPVGPDTPVAAATEPAADPQPNELWSESLLTDRNARTPDPDRDWDLDVTVRGYYLNDQRIYWSGMEATFGAEGVLSPVFRHSACGWDVSVEGEFYLNQPFDRNMLVTGPERQSYHANFQTDTFEISQLFVAATKDDWTIAMGKRETPFGRVFFPLFTNARSDAPFIRTESILWRETGLFVRYQPGLFVADVAMTNGSEDRDTNSSKALLARLGVESDLFVAGCSVKAQDGIGSDEQKQFNSHVGADCAIRLGRMILSGEVIYDQYGFWRSGYNPNDIFWRHSIYYREQNYRFRTPISGIGYYGNLVFQGSRWLAVLNYGQYNPQSIGDPRHDRTNQRGIAKFLYFFTPSLQSYTVVMQESDGFPAQLGALRRGTYMLTGLQYVF